MAKNKPLQDCRKAKDFDKHFSSHPDLKSVRTTGSHKIWGGPTGSVVTHGHGNKDIPRGTGKKIVIQAIAAGLILIVLWCGLLSYLQISIHGMPVTPPPI